ncbi:NADH-quinone oxidoreductase subunit N [Rhodocytophaga aerolata]|uniref:NADH-quinone oxidoreductase subunit N n=1 Tax=Rhodocytophaga aerolata TaxID=455078 RepID=A0ABT8RAS1_9BACT|nr:NADH-quinone oxidoreductase subunit N [Rhodocytophaga aerolata]MDO1448303.1 NADH-quinone oxidoreductase subunit N [Rhodocytophaga aerolata]
MLSDKLNQLLQSLSGFLPEVSLAALFVVLIIVDLIFYNKEQKPTVYIALAGLVFVGVLTYQQWNQLPSPISLFLGMIVVDKTAILFKGIFLVAAVLTLLLSLHNHKESDERSYLKSGEYVSLLVAITLGLHLMAMAANLLMIYLSVELVSISSYILATFKHNKKGSEGGLKYLLFGAMSSGIMLYGMSLLYGFTGTLSLSLQEGTTFITELLAVHSLPVLLAVFLTVGGLLFKIAAAPFHIWAPDVYESAPTPVVAFFSVAPKAAGFAVLLRFLLSTWLLYPDQIGSEHFSPIRAILIAIAILTLIVGNFSALWQKNAKRMLAYSSIAHAGFMLAGLLAVNELGWQSVLFYLVVYLFMNFAAFLLIDAIYQQRQTEEIEDYKGLGIQNQFLGVAFLIVMIALTGLPPTAGFTAKLFIFSALWQDYQSTGDNLVLLLFVVGLFNVVVALFYYLRIPYYMFFRSGKELNTINLGMYTVLLLVFLIVAVFLFFFKADWLMNIITAASIN